eukprot:4452482-Pyramimonas_sp.AAC.1
MQQKRTGEEGDLDEKPGFELSARAGLDIAFRLRAPPQIRTPDTPHTRGHQFADLQIQTPGPRRPT